MRGIRGPDAGEDDLDDLHQHLISHGVAVSIVNLLEPVDVDEGHAVAALQVRDEIVQIQPGIGFRQGILVEIQQHRHLFALDLISPLPSLVMRGGHFQHTFPAGNTLIPGKDKIHLSITDFQFTEPITPMKRPAGGAVLAPVVSAPCLEAASGVSSSLPSSPSSRTLAFSPGPPDAPPQRGSVGSG